MSGAMIRISKSDDPNTSPSTERQIMITGNADSVALAKSLINMSLDLHKASLERAGRSSEDEDSGEERREERRGRGRAREERPRGDRYYNEGSAEGLTGLASLLTKPDVLAAVNILGQLGGIGGSSTGSLNQVTCQRSPARSNETCAGHWRLQHQGQVFLWGRLQPWGKSGHGAGRQERHKEEQVRTLLNKDVGDCVLLR